MNSTSRIETFTRFLRESRARRIYVALHDIEHVSKRCPRLIALMSSYTSALLIFQTHGEAAKVQDCFVLADGDHLVRRPVRTQARGVLVTNDPKECQPMRERFEEIWEASRSEEHTSELQSPCNLVCRRLLEKRKTRAYLH